MYPVLSALRRMATHHIYLAPSQVEAEGNRHVVRSKEGVHPLDFSTGKWFEQMEVVPLFEITATGDTQVEVATSLSVAETKLYMNSELQDTQYTLLTLPELERKEKDCVRRTIRVGVVQGVHLANPSDRPPPTQKRKAVSVTYAKLKLPGLQEL